MTDKGGQYARQAADWTERAYADVTAYLAHRADLIVSLGPRLEAGDEVLDLACGDGGLGEALIARGLRYQGVDSTPEMVDAARERLGPRATVELGDLNEYAPSSPVAATTVFRAIYYARDRRAFFGRAAEYTQTKLVFDLNPRQYRRRGRARGSPQRGLLGDRAATVLRSPDRLAPRSGSRRGQGARAERPRSRASRCARASPTSSPRRASCRTRGWKPARSMTAPRGRLSLLEGSTLARNEGWCDRDLHAPRDARRAECRAVSLTVGYVERARLGDALDPRLLVRADPDGADPDRHLPGRASARIRAPADSGEANDRETGLVVGHVVARVGRACDPRLRRSTRSSSRRSRARSARLRAAAGRRRCDRAPRPYAGRPRVPGAGRRSPRGRTRFRAPEQASRQRHSGRGSGWGSPP